MGVIGNKSRTGMINSPEMRKHISEGMKGHQCGLGNKSRTGQKNSPESIAKFKATWKSKNEQKKSERHAYLVELRRNNGICPSTGKPYVSLKGRKLSEDIKNKMSQSKKGKSHPAHDKISEMCKSRKGFHHTNETREKMSISHKGKPVSPQCLAKATESNTGRVKTKEERAKISAFWKEHKDLQREVGKAAWKDPKKVKIMVGNMRKARQAKPNKLEFSILEILNKHFPNEWQYVGNGGLVLGRCCPDFVRNHGHNQVIEIYGDYWHQGENPQDRIDLFDGYGYKTLVIWESEFYEIKEQGFVQRVLKFMQEVDLFYYNPSNP